ncbi:hypothetical protein HMPREF0204_15237 [Chryseobacterium gleum ATCC 35910]|uniref:Uncharacterized protein n=1 Tax=Chryseobacterium gleum ATCC 35910 TaxID=525257 RepID=A0ABN0AT82_CHRGE|nr:hypothetical protein HMPREF0204_15237 [Chryseobacterium gleum ATCC 35910]
MLVLFLIIDKRNSILFAIRQSCFPLLAKNGIKVDDEEIAVILDLLYLISKNYKKPEQKTL